jgi:hypothetical protein
LYLFWMNINASSAYKIAMNATGKCLFLIWSRHFSSCVCGKPILWCHAGLSLSWICNMSLLFPVHGERCQGFDQTWRWGFQLLAERSVVWLRNFSNAFGFVVFGWRNMIDNSCHFVQNRHSLAK